MRTAGTRPLAGVPGIDHQLSVLSDALVVDIVMIRRDQDSVVARDHLGSKAPGTSS